MEGLDVVGLVVSGNEVLESFLVFLLLGDFEVDGGFDGFGSFRFGFVGVGFFLGGFFLNIVFFFVVMGRGGGVRGGRGSSLSGGVVVIVDVFYVVFEVLLFGEFVVGNGVFVVFIGV